MSECEIDTCFAAATVDDRLLPRSEHREEARDGVFGVEGATEVRLVLPPSAKASVSVDRGSTEMDFSGDAARVFVDEARGVEGVRSNEYEDTGARVRMDRVFRAPDGKMGRPSEAQRTIACDGVRVSDTGAGKGEHGGRYFLSKQSVAETAASDGGNGEVVEAKQETGQTRVSSWCDSRLEASEAGGSWMYGFEVGDMVWGKVKSHPWWPGHIFNEAFASSSVRRTKREGHVLVAFFGDSSYGWFDPAELVPFDPHYAEKSRQTTSRNFVKAVDEAVDEASRRSALGLSCCCRNPSNFRPTTVPGYFVVDVAGYEPGGVYSSKQIKLARDDFVSAEVLSFMNQLAVMPQDSEQGSIELIRKTATLFALRKAMFEEFDVTYAEAFGVQPVLPSRATQGGSDQHEKVPFRVAPLSGPLVIAEALGERKSSSKAVVRAKDTSAKKNKYLLKRREEPSPTGSSLQTPPPSAAGTKQRPPLLPASSTPGHAPATSPPPDTQYAAQGQGTVHYSGLAGRQLSQPGASHFPQVEEPNVHYIPHVQADVVVAAELGNYVLQKRIPEKQQSFPTKQEVGKVPVPEFGALSPSEARGASHPSVRDVGVHKISQVPDERRLKTEQPAGEGVLPIHEEGSATVKVGSGDGNKTFQHEYEPVVDAKETVNLKTTGVFTDAEEKPRFPQTAADQMMGFPGSAAYVASSPVDVVKKEKPRKHSREGEVDGEKKKKRKKKEGGLETSMDHSALKHKKKNGESLRLSAGRSIGIGVAYPDNSPAEAEMKVDGVHNSDSAIQQLPKLDLVSHSLDLPAVLGDLSALALDPFYGAERNAAAVVRHVLLRFRSLVYEKALPFPPTGEHETPEPHPSKFRAPRPLQEANRESAGAAKDGEHREPREPTKAHKAAVKPASKPDDPTKMGRKRMPSDRQEEKLAKRLKKLDKLKALTSEKKTGIGIKTTDVQARGEQKDTGAVLLASAKVPKADSIKKQEAPAPPKVAVPTYLVMKFPQRTTLPSISSLKARFARFGPLDLSGTRVFWKSYTCRVLFKHKPDAQAACNYAQSNDIFGQVKVIYFLRELEFPADAADPVKRLAEAPRSEDNPQFRPAGGGDLAGDLKPTATTKQQSMYSGQLKSILKKPSSDEAAPTAAAAAKESQRVKFMLGGNDSGKGEPLVVVSSSNNGGSNTGGILPTPAPLLDVNRKPPKSVTFLPPLQPPLQPPPRPHQDVPHPVLLTPPPPTRVALLDVPGPRGAMQFSKAAGPPHLARHGEAEVRERSGVDISHQMLGLLARCSDIVSNVESMFGYVPYHPL